MVFECGVLRRTPRVTEGTAELPGHYLDGVSLSGSALYKSERSSAFDHSITRIIMRLFPLLVASLATQGEPVDGA